VGTVVFDVEDVERAFALLDERGGTSSPTSSASRTTGARWRCSPSTPFGDTTFASWSGAGSTTVPGFVPAPAPPGPGTASASSGSTTDVELPDDEARAAVDGARAGLETFWQSAFHTNDVAAASSGARLGPQVVVMWDPTSGVKFANNEPCRPFFKESQINIFARTPRRRRAARGAVREDIVGASRAARRGVEFMPTPAPTTTCCPSGSRLAIERIDEDIERAARAGDPGRRRQAPRTCCRSS
jgi:4-hydroxyphenylpyruvate dioxygenase